MGSSQMQPPTQHSGSITFCLAGNPNLTYEWRRCTLAGCTPARCTGGAMDTGAHALTDTDMHGDLTRGFVLYTTAPPGRILVPHSRNQHSFFPDPSCK